MDRSEKVKLVEKVVKHIEEYDKQRNIAYSCFGYNSKSAFGDSVSWLVDTLVESASVAIGDSGEWLSWYLWDCKRDSTNNVSIDGSSFTVDSVEDLITLIEEAEVTECSSGF